MKLSIRSLRWAALSALVGCSSPAEDVSGGVPAAVDAARTPAIKTLEIARETLTPLEAIAREEARARLPRRALALHLVDAVDSVDGEACPAFSDLVFVYSFVGDPEPDGAGTAVRMSAVRDGGSCRYERSVFAVQLHDLLGTMPIEEIGAIRGMNAPLSSILAKAKERYASVSLVPNDRIRLFRALSDVPRGAKTLQLELGLQLCGTKSLFNFDVGQSVWMHELPIAWGCLL